MIELGKQLKYYFAGILPRDINLIPQYKKYNNDFLFSVAIWWKINEFNENVVNKHKINNMIDSGGFSIKMESKTKLPFQKCSNWQLRNGDITFIRDIGTKYENDINEVKLRAKESYENGLQLINMKKELGSKTIIYNVMHGGTNEQINEWYNTVKTLDTDGWGFGAPVGATNGLIYQMIMALYILKNEEGKKHNFHFFATTSKEEIALLAYFVDEFSNRINQVSFDNTSPVIAAVNKSYALPLYMTAMNIGKLSKLTHGELRVKDFNTKSFCSCEACHNKSFDEIYTDVRLNNLHNYIQFVDGIKFILFTKYNMNETYDNLLNHRQSVAFLKSAIDSFKRNGEISKIPDKFNFETSDNISNDLSEYL